MQPVCRTETAMPNSYRRVELLIQSFVPKLHQPSTPVKMIVTLFHSVFCTNVLQHSLHGTCSRVDLTSTSIIVCLGNGNMRKTVLSRVNDDFAQRLQTSINDMYICMMRWQQFSAQIDCEASVCTWAATSVEVAFAQRWFRVMPAQCIHVHCWLQMSTKKHIAVFVWWSKRHYLKSFHIIVSQTLLNVLCSIAARCCKGHTFFINHVKKLTWTLAQLSGICIWSTDKACCLTSVILHTRWQS